MKGQVRRIGRWEPVKAESGDSQSKSADLGKKAASKEYAEVRMEVVNIGWQRVKISQRV